MREITENRAILTHQGAVRLHPPVVADIRRTRGRVRAGRSARRCLVELRQVPFSAFTLTSLVLLVVGPKIAEAVAHTVGLGPVFALAWNVLRWPVATMLVLVGVASCTTWRRTWSSRGPGITPGSIFAVAAWLAASAGLRFYVAEFTKGRAGKTRGFLGMVRVPRIIRRR